MGTGTLSLVFEASTMITQGQAGHASKANDRAYLLQAYLGWLMSIRTVAGAVVLAVVMSSSALAAAPEPAKAVDAARFYSGRWIEIGRRPMMLTNNCVAGTTDYKPQGSGTVGVVDSCRRGTPTGKLVSLAGKGTLLDPGTNAKLRVRYNFLVTWDYWVLDHADDYSWFISADPKFKNLWIYTRATPSPEALETLIGRAKALGYDTDKLEFPTPPVE